MNICIVTSSYPLNFQDASAAAGLFVRDFALTLAEQGHHITVLTQDKDGQHEDDEGINIVRFKWTGGNKRLSTLSLKKPSDYIDMISVMMNGKVALHDLINKGNIELIIAMWAVPGGYWAYQANKKLGIPYIVWTLGSDIWVYGRKRITRGIVRRILKRSSKIYSDGEELRRETERLSGQICTFLPTTRVLPKTNLPEIKFEVNKVHFLYIGRFHPHKGVDLLLDAVHLLDEAVKDKCQIHIYGGGQLEAVLEEKVVRYNLSNVSINGYVNAHEVSALMQAANFLIIPSREESIPVVMSDALQSKLPLIVSNVGDMGQLVSSYHVGYVFEKEDIAGLSGIITKAIEDMKNKYSDQIDKLYEMFNISNIAIKLLDDATNHGGKPYEL